MAHPHDQEGEWQHGLCSHICGAGDFGIFVSYINLSSLSQDMMLIATSVGSMVLQPMSVRPHSPTHENIPQHRQEHV